MTPHPINIIVRSIKYYKKPVFYQVIIIALLTAVITGSLLTGRSVKESLKKSSTERLGNTGIVISSGIRYFDSDLVQRMKDSPGIRCTGIIEMNGYCQSLSSQKGAFNTHIYCVTKDFFIFHGNVGTVLLFILLNHWVFNSCNCSRRRMFFFLPSSYFDFAYSV